MKESNAVAKALELVESLRRRRTMPQNMYKQILANIREGGENYASRFLQGCAKESEAVPAQSPLRHSPATVEVMEQQAEDERQSGSLGFMARATVLATLPHSRPNSLEFKRRSGDYTLLLSVPRALHEATGISIPYGTMPRLIILWICTEITRTKEQMLYLGTNRSAFMRQIGLTPVTGSRGNIRKFQEQMHNLLGVYWSAWRTHTLGDGSAYALDIKNRILVSEARCWWDTDTRDKRCNAFIRIDEQFYQELLTGSFPINRGALLQLKDSSLAIDAYCWLTYRYASLTAPRLLPWIFLYEQFGSDEYRNTPEGHRNFRGQFKRVLKRALAVYPEAKVFPRTAGLMLYPSPSAIPKRLPRKR